MNIGIAIFGTGVVLFVSLVIFGCIMDELTKKRRMDWWPVLGTVFGIAMVLALIAIFLGFISGMIMFIWSWL